MMLMRPLELWATASSTFSATDGSKLRFSARGFTSRLSTIEGARLFRRRGAFLGTSRMTIRGGLLRLIGPVPEAIEFKQTSTCLHSLPCLQ